MIIIQIHGLLFDLCFYNLLWRIFQTLFLCNSAFFGGLHFLMLLLLLSMLLLLLLGETDRVVFLFTFLLLLVGVQPQDAGC